MDSRTSTPAPSSSSSTLSPSSILSDLNSIRTTSLRLPPGQSHSRIPSKVLPLPVSSLQLTPSEAVRQCEAFLTSSNHLLERVDELESLGKRIGSVQKKAVDIDNGLEAKR